jgi:hypothetical protein
MALVSGPTVGQAIGDSRNALPGLVGALPDDAALVDELFMRILNRSATPAERQAVLDNWSRIGSDHAAIQASLAEREQAWIGERARLESEREQQLAATQAQLGQRSEALQPEKARLEQERSAKIQAAEAAVAQATTALRDQLPAFRESHRSDVEWFPLDPTALSATAGQTLQRLEDRSIQAAGNGEKTVYTFTTRTGLWPIRGLRLEALPVAGITGGGPGQPENGNFVITELEVFAAPADRPDQLQKIALSDSRADFTQGGFDIRQTHDGETANDGGWAVYPAGGTVHWAVWDFQQPVGFATGTIVEVRIHQYHNAERHRLARFRLSAATVSPPLALGVPESFARAGRPATEPLLPSDEEAIVGYLSRIDGTLMQRQQELAAAQQPVAELPELAALQQQISALQQPTPDDPRLLELRADAAQSSNQLEQLRLTAAQDLAWALINSPSFLFNR